MHASGTPFVDSGERKQGDNLTYDLARLIGSPFSYYLIGKGNIQSPGPAIYVANHLGAVGPLAVILSIPIRFYPWIIAEMMDPKRAAQYLLDDFVHPVMHLSGNLGSVFSSLLSRISVRLFYAIGAVSIDRFGGLSPDGFRHSLRLLREGKNLLIFPEDPLREQNPQTSIRPFMPGFAALCGLFQAEQKYLLPVYPVAVNAGCETVAIGCAETLKTRPNWREHIDAFTQLLEERVKQLYIILERCGDDLFV